MKEENCTCGLQTKKEFREPWYFIPCDFCLSEGR